MMTMVMKASDGEAGDVIVVMKLVIHDEGGDESDDDDNSGDKLEM